MRFNLLGTLVIVLTGILISSILAGREDRLNIAVLDLDPTGIALPDAQFLSDRLRTELFETGKFQIVERDKMNEILKEQGFQQTGCTSVECAVEIGQLLNVQVMVAGNIGKIEDLYSLSIRMIDVKSGAIISTATKDYEGRLSEVLTEIVPEVAGELAASDMGKEGNNESGKNAGLNNDKISWSRFGVLLQGGFGSPLYAADMNKEIEKINATIAPDISELSGHYALGLELRYAFSKNWQIKLGFSAESPLSAWQASLTDYTSPANSILVYRAIELERKNRFVNTYLGLNYALWNNPGTYDIYLGFDLGSTNLDSEIYFSHSTTEGKQSDYNTTYTASSFTWKLSVGGTYFLSRAISLGMSLQFKSVQPFNLSAEMVPPEVPAELIPVFFPDEINASGILLMFYSGFHF